MPKPSSHISMIHAIMERYGQMGIPHLTALCHQEGVWTPDEWTHMAFEGAKKQVRAAVKVKMANGLPFAVPTRTLQDKSPVWSQLTLLNYDDALFYLYKLCDGVFKDVKQVNAFQSYMLDRWGHAPSTPSWGFADDADTQWFYEQQALDDEDDEDDNWTEDPDE